jgi:NAD(P)-dependent dehydrogenase (short-subunit alcohol dehydrogenase family)
MNEEGSGNGAGVRMLEGKTALVTGAANGIGRATVERFLAEGASVVAVDLTVGDRDRHPRLEWIEADVTDDTAVVDAAAYAARFGGLDICVANAGVGLIEDFVSGSRESWMRVFSVNLLAVMVTLQAAARMMIERGRGGRLLATASISGLRGEAHAPSTAYAASKAAVMGLMRAISVEVATHGITANAVAPGQIDTELNAADLEVMSARQGRVAGDLRAAFLAEQVPVRRMGRPSEVAALFAFLASDEASYITGSTFRIDGGELAI